ncbi:MAG: hypothetical protein HY769_08625, partial [Candidatus Stahlbacteria bacterium]|nr:hypothetical protein [Candidatus Stahlbacteria bacterium]
KDIILKIDNELVDILEINKIRECVGENQSIFGYLIQSSLPKHQTDLDYYLISITLRDSQTNEKGEGCLYWKKPCYV